MTVLLVAAVVVVAPLAVLLARPVIGRLAVRNAVRRPREAVLVMLGSLLGTAIITSALVVGDTLDASIIRSAFTQLGPIDVLVAAADPAVAAEAERRAAGRPGVDGVLPLTALTVTAVAPGPHPRAEPRAQLLEVDFERARVFGGQPGATGMSGPTPSPGEVVLGADLARTLGVDAGDVVDVAAYGTSRRLRVAHVLPRLGVAGFVLDRRSSASPTLFVTPGTAAELRANGPAPGVPPVALVGVSLSGGVLDAAVGARGRTASPDPASPDPASPDPAGPSAIAVELERELAGVGAATVRPVKADLVKAARRTGAQFTELFGLIGLFSVLAGVLLLVNIFVMLAQERQAELGMLRAVGLRRSGLVASFSLEGWLYSLGSTVAGTVAGIGIGRVVVAVAAGIFSQGDRTLELRFTVAPSSVRTGFAVGLLISLATVVATAVRISRLDPIRAIRDLPELVARGPRRAGFLLAAGAAIVGSTLLATGVTGPAPAAALVGPCLVAAGLARMLQARASRRARVTAASTASLAWAVLAFDAFPSVFANTDIDVYVVQGLILTAAAVALASQHQEAIGGAVRRLRNDRSVVLRVGLAYPLARSFRTALTLGMYALVVYTLASITTFSSLFTGQIDRYTKEISGGFDLVVESNPANPVPAEVIRRRPDVVAVAALTSALAEWEAPGSEGLEPWPVAAVDETFVGRGGPALVSRPAAYSSDDEAYRALLEDPSLVVVSEFFLQDDGGPPTALRPGTRVTMTDPLTGRSAGLTVAAVAESGFGNIRSLVGPGAFAPVFAERARPDLLHVATAAGADTDAVARGIAGEFVANGAEARSFRSLVRENLGQQLQFMRLMQGYLALGLVVGIAGLGVVMVRAVRERRRQIGVLRALGFPAGAVRRAFLTESAFVTVEGTAIGVVLAVVTAWRLVGSGTFGEDLDFSVPVVDLALLFTVTLVASLLATAAPARQAARIHPAVALRITD